MGKKRKRCEHLLDNCRNPDCERWFRRDERFLECPECGTTRVCGQPRQTGSKYCYVHTDKTHQKQKGRKVVTGASSKSELTRMSSKYSDMAQKYDKVSKSGLYLSNQAAIQTLDSRIIELLERLKDNDTPNRVRRLIHCWNALDHALPDLKMYCMADKNAEKAYNNMVFETTRAYHDYESWNQIFSAFDLHGRLKSQEMKIWKEAKAIMTMKDGMEMTAQLLSAVIATLKDEPNGQKYIRLIRYKFATIIGEADIDNFEGGGDEVIDIDAQPVDRESFLYPRDAGRSETEGEDPASTVSEGLSG